jgi:hypothetical protein
MNVIKGLDRIAIIIASIVALLGLKLGYDLTREAFVTVTKVQVTSKSKPIKPLEGIQPREPSWFIIQEGKIAIPKVNYPPFWQCTIGSILSAAVSFVVVLFGFRGMTRGIRRLSLWITEGFKEEK